MTRILLRNQHDTRSICMQAVSIVGDRKLNRWSSIAEMVHGRSQTQCRERWCNVLDPTVKTGTSHCSQKGMVGGGEEGERLRRGAGEGGRK